EGSRQVLDRTAARPEDHHLPGGAGVGHRAAVELGDHAGPHERGLAAARGPDHRQEAVHAQELQQRRDLLLAAKEPVVLVAAKGAETGKRVGTRGVNALHHSASFACRMAATKSVSKPGAKVSLGCRITCVETLLKRSLRWLKGGATYTALTGMGRES